MDVDAFGLIVYLRYRTHGCPNLTRRVGQPSDFSKTIRSGYGARNC